MLLIKCPMKKSIYTYCSLTSCPMNDLKRDSAARCLPPPTLISGGRAPEASFCAYHLFWVAPDLHMPLLRTSANVEASLDHSSE